MSIPRCWPAANGSLPVWKGEITAPRTGQRQPVEACVGGAVANTATTAMTEATTIAREDAVGHEVGARGISPTVSAAGGDHPEEAAIGTGP